MPSLEEVLRATSRTFAIGIEGLPRPLREEMRIAYLVLRVSDYLEDNTTLGPEEKATLLDSWADTLKGDALQPPLLRHLSSTDDPSPDTMAAHHVGDIVDALTELPAPAQSVIRTHTRDSTKGMARWVLRGPDIQTEADLDDYMHEVAGRVGYLITELFALASPQVSRNRDQMMALGQEFGLALQTVNIVRGIPADIERGWFFVPREFLTAPIKESGDFMDRAHRKDAVRIIDRLLEKASGHFHAAQRYIELLPRFKGQLRYFCLLPYFFGVRTLALSKENPDVLVSEVKLGRDEVRAIAGKSKLRGWSNSWVRRYARELGRRPRP